MSILGLFPPLTLYFTHLPWYSILSLSISIWILSGFRTFKSPPTCSIFTTSRPYNLNTLYLYLYLNYMVRDKAQPRIMASQQPNLEGSQRQVRGCGPEAVCPLPALVTGMWYHFDRISPCDKTGKTKFRISRPVYIFKFD